MNLCICIFYILDIVNKYLITYLLTEVDGMSMGTRYFSKNQWKKLVWTNAWALENRDWNIRSRLFMITKYIDLTRDSVKTLIWWQLGDKSHGIMNCCETMVKLVFRASRLKSDNYQNKNDPTKRPYCELCQNVAVEDVEHMIMHCPYFENQRNAMLGQTNEVERMFNAKVLLPSEDNLLLMLGKIPNGAPPPPEMMFDNFSINAKNVHKMYMAIVKSREGVG